MNHKLRRVVSMPLLIDQHIGSVTYIETIHDDSFLIQLADAVEFFYFSFCTAYQF